MSIERFEDLVAWQKAHEYALGVHRVTRQFPKEATFALTTQARRAAVSCPSNIVEGFTRWYPAEKAHHYNIAEASIEESRYQLLLAHDLGYADTLAPRNQALEAKRLIACLANSVRPNR